MHNPWVAIDVSTDRRAWAHRLARLRDTALTTGGATSEVRSVIRDSWRRSQDAGVDADAGLAPSLVGSEDVAARWEAHPFRGAVGAVRELLRDVSGDAGQVVLFCDRDGTLLWLDGDARTVDEAQAIHLAPGAAWSEQAAGTNAMGTALALEHEVQIFSSEHFCRPVADWTCSAAPVRDRRTGVTLGVLDMTGPLSTAHPHSLAAVTAAARVAEEIIAHTPLPGPAAGPLRLQALGRDRVLVDGRLELSRRHSELAVLLALRPEGWTADQLAIALLGDFGKPVTVRAELSRLRRLLGPALSAQPYRFAGPLQADFTAVEALLDAGRVREAVDACSGPLLPSSEVEAVAELRMRLELTLSSAVVADGDVALLERWLEHPCGREDETAAEALLHLAGDEHPGAQARLLRLRA